MFRCWAPVRPVLLTGLTGQSKAEAATLFAKRFACIRLGGFALVNGELASVHGKLFVVFHLWFGDLCSLLEHGFCLRCVEPLPLPKGSETCLLQVIFLTAFLIWMLSRSS
jgi:hypothetical protein